MLTSDGSIMALGECAGGGRAMVYGLVAPLYEMARVAAAHLTGDRSRPPSYIPTRRPN